MQRRLIRALATSVFPLIGLAAAFAMSGCAAAPAINLANSLIHPAQPGPPAQPGQPASTDMFGALAQQLGIGAPAAGAPAVQTATVPSFTTTPAPTTTAAK